MTSQFRQWTLDAHDVGRMAAFWSAALGYRIDRDEGGSVHLLPPADQPELWTVWLQPTDAAKAGKNRNHPDLVPVDDDVDAEVERLLGLGATHADVGQTGDEGFVVLADPEGNEFCLLRRPPNR
jgi:predicted enzyme related to lactoylglutathione lyase